MIGYGIADIEPIFTKYDFCIIYKLDLQGGFYGRIYCK